MFKSKKKFTNWISVAWPQTTEAEWIRPHVNRLPFLQKATMRWSTALRDRFACRRL